MNRRVIDAFAFLQEAMLFGVIEQPSSRNLYRTFEPTD